MKIYKHFSTCRNKIFDISKENSYLNEIYSQISGLNHSCLRIYSCRRICAKQNVPKRVHSVNSAENVKQKL